MALKEDKILTPRQRDTLGAVIKEYIKSAEPVGSRAIASNYGLGYSPATIRGIMAELERAGFLYQPHTSAGRMPTEKAFRLYVDALLEPGEVAASDRDILNSCFKRFIDRERTLAETVRVLSSLTCCTGLAFVVSREDFVIEDVKLLPVDLTSVVVVLVSRTGSVRTRFVKLGTEAAGLDIKKTTAYLNSLGRGLTPRQLRRRIIREMRRDKNLYEKLLSEAMKTRDDAPGSEDGSLYVEGKTNIFEYPELREDFEKMKRLFSAFEEKSLLVRILDRSMDEESIHVYLGSEFSIEGFEGLSFVTMPYGSHGRPSGTLGVIGPVRMDYSRVIPLVTYTAGLLKEVF